MARARDVSVFVIDFIISRLELAAYMRICQFCRKTDREWLIE